MILSLAQKMFLLTIETDKSILIVLQPYFHIITKKCPCSIQRFFTAVKKIDKQMINFLTFAQNIDCGYTLELLTSTNNLCFRANIRK